MKHAISDLLAWLTIGPACSFQPMDLAIATTIADHMEATPKLVWDKKNPVPEVFPVLRLDPGDASGTIATMSGEPVRIWQCSNDLAIDPRFWDQLLMRPEFAALEAESRKIRTGR